VSKALIAAALHDPDRIFVETYIEKLLRNDDPWIRGVAAIAAGHVARIHRELNIDRIVPLIRDLLNDPRTSGNAQDALDDIGIFLR
jgi:hypothetical protein